MFIYKLAKMNLAIRGIPCDLGEKAANTFTNEMKNGNTIGSISEIYDSKNSKYGKGAFAQAWSISEVFRIIFGK